MGSIYSAYTAAAATATSPATLLLMVGAAPGKTDTLDVSVGDEEPVGATEPEPPLPLVGTAELEPAGIEEEPPVGIVLPEPVTDPVPLAEPLVEPVADSLVDTDSDPVALVEPVSIGTLVAVLRPVSVASLLGLEAVVDPSTGGSVIGWLAAEHSEMTMLETAG